MKQLLRKGGAIQEKFMCELVTHVISDKLMTDEEMLGVDCKAVVVHVRLQYMDIHVQCERCDLARSEGVCVLIT